ncbi:FAD-dependent oxidoreductase [Methylocystis sp. MJC1]|uniref:FAD-dependent oxidoreductase n=1 Tax=Methylocystis sp. MJC1 TaxID=2654282 RepID=UPI0013EDB19E|nr:FAD-dependent oxidoreductase [Methylocystis sp. MJC1]KAF2990455.1 Gamma-glutamylputrescine oxidoreductase [Methylocystis sp. MJC1]MBU6528250.1 FAD-dependent oxidoreductase [Methylocystis sp. MJC1]UZX11157.1 FAD-dependent oxidoreductase [Methylocystis sp. MJC1]
MNVSSERSKSIWEGVAANASRLQGETQADVAVIGSGIAGMSVAYELAKAGKKVAVIDRGPIGGGMTARTTAHLSSYSDDGFRALIDTRGLDVAKGWQESQAAAISRIEAIQAELGAACDFRRLDGFLFLAPETDPGVIESELVASAQVGMIALRQEGVPFAGQEATPALRFPNQATFHPTKYLGALAEAVSRSGGRFFSESPVSSVEEDENGVVLTTLDGARVLADVAVVATNAPINDRLAISAKQAPYRTYVVAFEIPRASLPDALYWDTLDPYHYVRLQPGDGAFDILIVGGEDHKTGESNDGAERIRSLTSWTRGLIPALGRETARWSGQVLEPMDYVGFIGRSPGEKRVYVATGDSGQGMTHGAVAGLLICDLILRGESPWQSVYDPSRKPVKAAGEFIKENVSAAKHFVDYLKGGEVASTQEIAPGHGAIVRNGLEKVAAYREADGTLYPRSASCTHVGCHVHWNDFEKCWDCPCHGSQFAPDGEALNAPAFSPLRKIES